MSAADGQAGLCHTSPFTPFTGQSLRKGKPLSSPALGSGPSCLHLELEVGGVSPWCPRRHPITHSPVQGKLTVKGDAVLTPPQGH